ncbi:hypothetical protein E2C01_053239 [Portunus trituberculatus]|uniref:Uncharacterized protein n=1 Tax=Portunus trituberculatus TaxID=210409 RepID=A0A5B7GNS8_PORTR|nr:hypothetical protein [Portunus trituberculatus]
MHYPSPYRFLSAHLPPIARHVYIYMTGSINLLFPVREPFSGGASAPVTRPSSPQHASRSQTPGATIAVATTHDDLLQRDYIIVRTTVRLYPFREDWKG